MSDVAIKVDNISKAFKLPHEKQGSIKGLFLNIFNGKRTYEHQQVLEDISFEIKKGEFFGIVGRNGSGKSTLLKLLAGIYSPDTGGIALSGKLTPFIELGVGFNPDLTGRENVFLNGALLGFDRSDMEVMYEDIVSFAELEKFMDQKLKNYSSGMQVRLAFSIAIRANSEILLLDEVLAVGDEAFQKKCFEYFAQLKKERRTVILVSHDMEAVRRFCDKALLLNEGKIVSINSSYLIAKEYSKLNERNTEKPTKKAAPKTASYKDAHITTRLLNKDNVEISAFNPTDSITIELELEVFKNLAEPVIGVTIEKSNQETIFAVTTEKPEKELGKVLKAGQKLHLRYEIENIFGEDTYIIDSAVVSKDRTVTYFRQDEAATFKVQNRGPKGWLLHPKYTVEIK